ncbi:hypothetical protein CLOM_g16110 [Closterium sp. NIES-68]|nr:hypothetical protein CLOM_g16110 [Closterium sp. NIES-68]GJP58593.1 hypothetical protein CLOP_g700 [Closterium sp. NIES-67]
MNKHTSRSRATTGAADIALVFARRDTRPSLPTHAIANVDSAAHSPPSSSLDRRSSASTVRLVSRRAATLESHGRVSRSDPFAGSPGLLAWVAEERPLVGSGTSYGRHGLVRAAILGGSIDAVIYDGFKPYFDSAPRWRQAPSTVPLRILSASLPSGRCSLSLLRHPSPGPLPPTESSAQRSALQQRTAQVQRRRRLAGRMQEALPFHRQFCLKPFELARGVATLPLEMCRGDHIITIVTTASLPWLTGTSINPLMRAAYLSRLCAMRVLLLLPWIPPSDQRVVHPAHVFDTRAQQEAFVREWIHKRLGFEPVFRISFYDAWYDPRKGSIFPLDRSDVSECVPDEEVDVAVLEEPEHLTWYHMVGPKWRIRFPLSLGIAHTNYTEYIKRDLQYGGPHAAAFLLVYSWLVARANCHRVIRLSGAVQPFSDSVVCNVHGVSPQFLDESHVTPPHASGVYFVGKVLWGKGYQELCDLMRHHCNKHGRPTLPPALPPAVPAAVRASTDRKADAQMNGHGNTLSHAHTNGHGNTLTHAHTNGHTNTHADADAVTDGHRNAHTGGACACDAPRPRNGCYHSEVGKAAAEGERKEEQGEDEAKGVQEEAKGKEGGEDGERFWVHAYGDGFEEGQVKAFAAKHELPIVFHGRKDHADPEIRNFKVFVNPSVSDVLCTTTAEAAAMGKILVLCRHPSNEFFIQNIPDNCVIYDPNDPDDFSAAVARALAHPPRPLTPEEKRIFTWQAATERFMQVAGLAAP